MYLYVRFMFDFTQGVLQQWRHGNHGEGLVILKNQSISEWRGIKNCQFCVASFYNSHSKFKKQEVQMRSEHRFGIQILTVFIIQFFRLTGNVGLELPINSPLFPLHTYTDATIMSDNRILVSFKFYFIAGDGLISKE